MPVFDTFSKQQKRLRGETNDVYTYDQLPRELKIQIVHICHDVFNHDAGYGNLNNLLKEVSNIVKREHSILSLSNDWHDEDYRTDIYNYFLRCEDTGKSLDFVGIIFFVIDHLVRHRWESADLYEAAYRLRSKISPDEAIDELNQRFKEHAVGYQYESGKIIRIDSQLIHDEIVKPTIQFLNQPRFAGAREEFLKAHEHYRIGNYKECLVECLKAFESTMKIICDKRKWPYLQRDTAKTLIEICLKNNLIEKHIQDHFTGIHMTLEKGIPTMRNKMGGHGQGTAQITVPKSLASYILHLTATTILFLIEADKEKV